MLPISTLTVIIPSLSAKTSEGNYASSSCQVFVDSPDLETKEQKQRGMEREGSLEGLLCRCDPGRDNIQLYLKPEVSGPEKPCLLEISSSCSFLLVIGGSRKSQLSK